MPKLTQPSNTREELLNACEQLLREHGITHLSLDRVAQHAKISKGGVLHHFPTKQALIMGVVERLLVRFRQLAEKHYQLEAIGKGRWLKAYVRTSFDVDAPTMELSKILGLANEMDALAEVVMQDALYWQKLFAEDGISPSLTVIVQRAADAQWIEEMIGVFEVKNTTSQDILERLIGLIEESK
jgi:AcrR family transcriptional regulator